MKVVILYHPESDHAREVETFKKDYESTQGGEVELISLETRDGADMARLYDIVSYPAVLAIRDNNELLKHWEEDKLPLMQEVASYQRS